MIIIAVAIGDYYFRSDRWLLFWWQSGIIISSVIGIVILTAIDNHYFSGDWRSWAKSFACPHWRTVKTIVQTSSLIPCCFLLCVSEKTDKFWFVANGWSNITRTAHWSAFAGPNEAFAHHISCSHYITRSLTRLIQSCGQGLKGHNVKILEKRKFSKNFG